MAAKKKAKSPRKAKAAATKPASPPPPATATNSPPPETAVQPVIVGVGASAGGLEALSALISTLPQDANMSLVVVQHMMRDHESMLARLLSGHTRLQVEEIHADCIAEPNHVYIVPPNRTVGLAGRVLELHSRPTDRSQYTPIDSFFQSLADNLQEHSIGVVLSGTAADGVEGIHAIKAVGGTVLVQSPESAKFDGMPRAAIETGKVDLILKPDEIAQHLVSLAKQRPATAIHPRRPGDGLPLDQNDLERIFEMLRGVSGVDFGLYKLPTVQRRIQRRMALHKVHSSAHYVKFFEENPAEIHQLYQDVLIHVTGFFREPESFEVLTKEVIPAILAARQGDSPIRVWVPACSTGEEPYSVAMSLIEALDDRIENVPIQIFATDISESAIDQARSGIYSATSVEALPSERLRRFFSRTDGHYRINKLIRDLCVFARQDLTRDPPFSKLDLILCRNVLIYLGQAVQSRLISVFHYALKSTGYLVLGSAETIGQHADLFAVADKKHRVYRKKVAETTSDVQFSLPYTRPYLTRGPRPAEEFRGAGTVQAEANRIVLDRYSPPGVLVNEDLRIIQFRGQTGRFLEPAPGDASLNLLKMCREGLLHGLRTAIQNAKKREAAVRREGLRVKTNGDFITLAVEVVPLPPAGEGRHYLVLFHAGEALQGVSTPAPPPRRPSRAAIAGQDQEEIDRLHKELIATREYLQSIIQDLEAANEELQSANEEILSSNEELQSTNEELDTAKEELQSTNEELNTVNEELHGRNEELARINSDLVNLLNGVQIAIVIVAGDLRIRRFTPMAERVLNLIPGDIGRPISQIKPNINVPDREVLISEVIDTVTVQHRDVQDQQGRMLSLTIRPYKNVDNRIDGAVLALFDIDEVRRHEREAHEAREFAEWVLTAAPIPLVVLDPELKVRSVNPAFCEQFLVDKMEAEGRSFLELGGGVWNLPDLRSRLERMLPGDRLEDVEYKPEFGGIGRKKVSLQGWRTKGSAARPANILLTIKAN